MTIITAKVTVQRTHVMFPYTQNLTNNIRDHKEGSDCRAEYTHLLLRKKGSITLVPESMFITIAVNDH